jgi:hypothetical protein
MKLGNKDEESIRRKFAQMTVAGKLDRHHVNPAKGLSRLPNIRRLPRH